MPTVAALHVYPVKGARGTDLTEAHITARGVRHDREFMVVDDVGHYLSQRTDPRLALLRPSYDGTLLRVAAPGLADLEHRVRPDGPHRPVRVGREDTAGVDQGDAAAAWFGAALGRPCRLVRFPDDHVRPVKAGFGPGVVAFADDTPLLVASLESLADLNARLPVPLPMNRFRPTVVLSGWDAPFAEDRTRVLRLGAVEVEMTRRCGRCEVTTVDQETGIKGHEPLFTLATFRQIDQQLMFGMHATPRTLGTVRVGDPVEVIEAAAPAAPAAPAGAGDTGPGADLPRAGV